MSSSVERATWFTAWHCKHRCNCLFYITDPGIWFPLRLKSRGWSWSSPTNRLKNIVSNMLSHSTWGSICSYINAVRGLVHCKCKTIIYKKAAQNRNNVTVRAIENSTPLLLFPCLFVLQCCWIDMLGNMLEICLRLAIPGRSFIW